MSLPIFYCVKLTESSVEKLHREIENTFPELKGTHCTLEFRPDKMSYEIGTKVRVRCTRLLTSNRLGIEAVEVELVGVESKNDFVHITLSHLKGVSPVKSNNLPEAEDLQVSSVLGINLDGVVAGFYPDRGYVTQ